MESTITDVEIQEFIVDKLEPKRKNRTITLGNLWGIVGEHFGDRALDGQMQIDSSLQDRILSHMQKHMRIIRKRAIIRGATMIVTGLAIIGLLYWGYLEMAK